MILAITVYENQSHLWMNVSSVWQ